MPNSTRPLRSGLSIAKFIACLGALALPAVSNAAVVVDAYAVVDLNSAISGSAWTGYALPLTSPVQVTSGDTVNINISFVGSQRLSWSSDGYFNPWLMLVGYETDTYDPNQVGSFNWSDVSVTFNGLTAGTQLPPGQLVGGTDGSIHLGPSLVLGNDSVFRTFSSATVSFLATWTGPVRDYGTLGYVAYPVFGGTVAIAAPIPEPSAGLAVALGFLGALTLRRRRD
jgi:hypothetical protein